MKRFTGSDTSSRPRKKISLRSKLFLAILGVSLACMIVIAILSGILGRWQVGEHFQRIEQTTSQSQLTTQGDSLPQEEPLKPGGSPPPGPEHGAKEGAQNWLIWSLLIAGSLGVVMALGLSYILANRVSEPVSDLTSATKEITEGKYGSKVDVKGGVELEELGSAFNTLSESLATNESLRKNMVADIAHELRNPLATLLGQIEAMEDGFVDIDEKAFSHLRKDALMLIRLVEDLHQLSLLEAGQLELDLMSLDIGETIGGVVTRFEHELQGKGVSLEVQIEEGLPPVMADQLRITQILSNLVKNSLLHSSEGDSIVISAAKSEDNIVFSVSDSGPGIEPDELPFIFERFYRTDKSRSRKTGGAGLGLSIARSLVEAQGGRIWADSVVGEGTTVFFSVPVFLVEE